MGELDFRFVREGGVCYIVRDDDAVAVIDREEQLWRTQSKRRRS